MARLGFTKHRKFLRLAAALGGDRARALGVCEFMWASRGEELTDYLGDATDVAMICEWSGDPDALVAALSECGGEGRSGLIDPVEGKHGKWKVHDLWDHIPDYVRKRLARETDRRERGKTISEMRSEAGRIGAAVKHFKQTDAETKQTDAACQANGAEIKQTGGTPPSLPFPSLPDLEKNGRKEDLPSGEAPRSRPLTKQQQRVKDAEEIIFKRNGIDPPPPASSIAKWLSMIDEDGLVSVVEEVVGSGKANELEGQKLTAYIFGCVKGFARDVAAMERGARPS